MANARHNDEQIRACKADKANCVTCEQSGGTTLHGTLRHSEALFGVPQYVGSGAMPWRTLGHAKERLDPESLPHAAPQGGRLCH